jgi:hypothetical protein
MPPGTWVVWLAAADDPALGVFVGEGDTLGEAFAAAFASWDGTKNQGEKPS